MPEAVYQAVMERSGGVCEAMIFPVCTGQVGHWHHRLMRSQGGKHEVHNGLALCSACHAWIHAHPEQSYKLGWLVKMSYEPLDVPVSRRGRVVHLDAEGGYEVAESE